MARRPGRLVAAAPRTAADLGRPVVGAEGALEIRKERRHELSELSVSELPVSELSEEERGGARRHTTR